MTPIGVKRVFWFLIGSLLFGVWYAKGATWYVSPAGTGNGATISTPMNFAVAISNSSIAAGDIVWLRGGTYSPTNYGATFPVGNVNRAGWEPTISGSSGSQIVFASYPGEWAAIDRLWSLGNAGCGYLCFSNLEFYDSLKGHNLVNTTGPPSPPPWVHFPMGSQTGFTWVNCVIHDVHDCFGSGAQGFSVRGCVFWYVGWNLYEHVCYPAPASFTGNICLWQLQNVLNGLTANTIFSSNIVAGGGNTEANIQSINTDIDSIGYNSTISYNSLYNRLNNNIGGLCLNGIGSAAGTVNIFSNYFVNATPVYDMGTGTALTALLWKGNVCYGSFTNRAGPVLTWATASGQTGDYNQYFSVPSGLGSQLPEFTINGSTGQTFSQWQTATGMDTHGSAGTSPGQMPANAVNVYANTDAPKRASIAIYNWTLANNVSVSLSGVLNSGDTYSLYSALNYNGSNVSGAVPIATGTYNGTSISVPMTNLSVAPILWGTNTSSDNEPISQPPNPSPEFGAFIVQGASGGTTYTVTVSAGNGGSVTPSGAQIISSGGNLSCAALPASGYSVYQWTLDGTVVQTGGTSYTLSNVTANHAIAVTFYPANGPYYIDWASGSDANAGTSTGAPWQHHPYMVGFTGAYVHQAGDQFIFRGGTGEVWPSSCFPLTPISGGSTGSYDQYTVQSNWFNGGSFSRPVFDGGHAVNQIIAIGAGIQWLNFNCLEMRAINGNVDGVGIIAYYDTANLHGNLLWLHDWTTTATNDSAHGAWIGSFDGAYGITNIVLANSEISNVEHPTNGEAIRYGGVFTNCLIHDNSSAIVFAQDVNHCTLYNICYPPQGFDATFHWNGFYMDNANGVSPATKPCYLRNSYFYNVSSGANMAYANIEKADCWIYGNLFYGVMSAQQAVNVDTFDYGGTGVVSNVYILNNGIVVGTNIYTTGTTVANRPGLQASNVIEFNNLAIGNSASWPNSTATNQYSYIVNYQASNNAAMTVAAAAAAGYTLANLYAETSVGNPTVAAGNAIPFNNGVIVDILGNPRFLPMDIGAYQLQSNSVSVSAGPNGGINPTGTVAVPYQGNLTASASPNAGYGVNQWTTNGVLAQTGGTSFAFNGIATNSALAVTFAALPSPTRIQIIYATNGISIKATNNGIMITY